MGTLNTYEYKVLLSEVKAAIPVTGIVNDRVLAELGMLHERGLGLFEDDKIREDEFLALRDILRGYGLTELFC